MPTQTQKQTIDINHKGLLDWLVERGKLARTWPKQLRKVREAVRRACEALVDPAWARRQADAFAPVRGRLADVGLTAPEGVQDIDIVEKIDFEETQRLFDLVLKGCEADPESTSGKSLLGYFRDERLAALDAALRLYKGKCMVLAETCRQMKQACEFDMPALRARKDESDKRISHIHRKLSDIARSSRDGQKRLEERLAELGLTAGERQFEDALKAQAPQLGKLLRSVHSECRAVQVREAAEYYFSFCSAVHEADSESLLPTLRQLLSTEVDDEPVPLDELQTEEAHIDEVEVGQGGDDEEKEEAAFEISWDIEDVAADDDGDGDGDGEAVEIDWGISQVIEGEEEENENENEKGRQDSTLLDATSRLALAQDLEELSTFLKQRLEEKHTDLSSLGGLGMDISMQDGQLLAKRRDAVESVLATLRRQRMRQLVSIGKGSGAFHAMIHELQSAVRREEKLAALSASLREERGSLLSQVQQDGPRLDGMRQKTRERAAWAEKELGRLYGGEAVFKISVSLA